jgi:hypothetical protein
MIIASITFREHLRTESCQNFGDFVSYYCKQGSRTDENGVSKTGMSKGTGLQRS